MYSFITIFLATFFLSHCFIKTSHSAPPRCWNDINFEETEKLLLTLTIQKKIPMEKYLSIKTNPNNSPLFILVFNNNLKAVFKPNRSKTKMQSSIMSYHFSQFMKWNLIPPTVIRTIDGSQGVVQLFIDNFNDRKYKSELARNLTPVQKSNIFTYYFVSGNFDGSLKNILFGKACRKPALIDNEQMLLSTFIQYGDYPFMPLSSKVYFSKLMKSEKFPSHRIQLVNTKKISNYKIFFEKIFENEMESNYSKQLINWYSQHNKSLDGGFYYVKWNNSSWIKMNILSYKLIFKDFLPVVFQENTIKKLNQLNNDILNSFSPDFSVPPEINKEILYRRDVILKEALKLKRSSKKAKWGGLWNKLKNYFKTFKINKSFENHHLKSK